mmetsp:Transcript_65046/g.74764  ORF Transcript_65046/g.74764 Transcript_65046/m.74764 type:complete len:112 (-) Transcript_65046:63-398(-)
MQREDPSLGRKKTMKSGTKRRPSLRKSLPSVKSLRAHQSSSKFLDPTLKDECLSDSIMIPCLDSLPSYLTSSSAGSSLGLSRPQGTKIGFTEFENLGGDSETDLNITELEE